MPLIELIPKTFVPAFSMTLNYLPVPPQFLGGIMDIRVEQKLDPPNSFSFRVNDPKLQLIDPRTGIFTEGSRVEISLGYVGNTKSVIVGEISALSADFPSSGPATLEVQGFDLLHRLTRGTCYREFPGPNPDSNEADSVIVSRIAAEMQLIPNVDSTGPRSEPRTQRHETNFKFLQELAAADGYYVWVDGNTLYFKKERPAPKKIQLEWHKTLISFSPRISTAGQVKTVKVRGWDPRQKQSFSASADRSDSGSFAATGVSQISQGSGGQSEVVIANADVDSADEAQAYAQSYVSALQQKLIRGHGTAIGQADMQVGTYLILTGIGRFNGTYVTEHVTHTFGGSGYQTSFDVIGTQS